jgi:alanine-glyoxylate transaminase/serine-glyoxylate transaminase/serine-pyruvate transaminase
MAVDVDGWRIDACYSGTQKCLSCPPGLSPVTFSAAAEQAIANRKTKVRSWYLDMNMVRQYWGSERLYHHTAPINMIYGLHEALRIVLEEGLQRRWQRHHQMHCQLKRGLEALGFTYLADPRHQLPMLNAVALPAGLDEAAGRKRLLEEFGIEVGAGLGAYKGKAWRIGLMGESATERHVSTLLEALRKMIG